MECGGRWRWWWAGGSRVQKKKKGQAGWFVTWPKWLIFGQCKASARDPDRKLDFGTFFFGKIIDINEKKTLFGVRRRKDAAFWGPWVPLRSDGTPLADVEGGPQPCSQGGGMEPHLKPDICRKVGRPLPMGPNTFLIRNGIPQCGGGGIRLQLQGGHQNFHRSTLSPQHVFWACPFDLIALGS